MEILEGTILYSNYLLLKVIVLYFIKHKAGTCLRKISRFILITVVL